MKQLLLVLTILIALGSARLHAAEAAGGKKRFVIYAEFIEDTPVELSDGSKWVMDKGDCFPVHMFKEQRTKAILQLASATFWTDSVKIKVVPESPDVLERYRKMVDNYLKSQPDKWKQRTQSDQPAKGS